jgi:hypothetical protein
MFTVQGFESPAPVRPGAEVHQSDPDSFRSRCRRFAFAKTEPVRPPFGRGALRIRVGLHMRVLAISFSDLNRPCTLPCKNQSKTELPPSWRLRALEEKWCRRIHRGRDAKRAPECGICCRW